MSNANRRNLLLGLARMKGIRIADIAEQIGVHRTVIYKIIAGTIQSPKVATVLYQKLGCTKRMREAWKQ